MEQENIFEHIQETDNVIDEAVLNNNVESIPVTNAKVLGAVIYGEKSFYKNEPNENEQIHLKFAPKNILREIKDYYENVTGQKVKQITAGHEHGKVTKKCHYQICIEFDDNVRRKIKPSVLTCEGQSLLIISQKAKNPYALKNYCKKENDVIYLHDELVVKYEKTDKGRICIFKTIINNKTKLTCEEMDDLLQSNVPKDYFQFFNSYQSAIRKLASYKPPEFEWTFPEYLIKVHPLIHRWFVKFCGDNTRKENRKLALVLYSKKPGLGKSYFAKHLVNHPFYYIYFRGQFNGNALFGKENAELVILDDMAYPDESLRETWKNLMAGEEGNLSGKYVNLPWTFKIPCIICTNNLNLIALLQFSDQMNGRAWIIEINDYMGAPGTKDDILYDIETEITKETQEELEEIRDRNIQKKAY
jgi:hypothetical protein